MMVASYGAPRSAPRYSATRLVSALRLVTRRAALSHIVILTAMMLGACSQMGPQALIAGRPQYNIAVQQTEAEQLLLNIVRNRYNDTILFLDITSISSGFSRGMNTGLLGSFSSGSNSGATNLGGDIRDSRLVFLIEIKGTAHNAVANLRK